MRPHRALAASLAKQLRQAGAEVDLERTVPELLRRTPGVTAQNATPERPAAEEAKLDLVVSWPGGSGPCWIDVSVRCPHAREYEYAHKNPGNAAEQAAKDKDKEIWN